MYETRAAAARLAGPARTADGLKAAPPVSALRANDGAAPADIATQLARARFAHRLEHIALRADVPPGAPLQLRRIRDFDALRDLAIARSQQTVEGDVDIAGGDLNGFRVHYHANAPFSSVPADANYKNLTSLTATFTSAAGGVYHCTLNESNPLTVAANRAIVLAAAAKVAEKTAAHAAAVAAAPAAAPAAVANAAPAAAVAAPVPAPAPAPAADDPVTAVAAELTTAQQEHAAASQAYLAAANKKWTFREDQSAGAANLSIKQYKAMETMARAKLAAVVWEL